MNTISRTALSNFKKNKSRNLLIGIAVAMSAFLLTAVPTVIMGYVDLQHQAVNECYPTFHAMFRDVDGLTAQKVMKDSRIEQAGLREDTAEIYCGSGSGVRIPMLFIDQTAAKLSRQQLAEGRFPEKADEIVLSDGVLETLGLTGSIGDQVEIPFQTMTENGTTEELTVVPSQSAAENKVRQSRTFTIVGMIEDSEISLREKIYFTFVSDAFAKEILKEEEHQYRMYFRMNGIDENTTDAIKDQIEGLGREYGIAESDVVFNTDYLRANYIDPATYAGLAVVLAVVALAGAFTIYGIYYVSMLDKVQEYGRLRAIGATKRQIRQLVFREGLAVAATAIPIGIILGLLAGVQIVRVTEGMSAGSEGTMDVISAQISQIIERNEAGLIKPWIILFSMSVSLVMVYLSLLRPMRTAAKISAIEALRYQGNEGTKKKQRKGYEEINTRKLTLINLSRNKKRTAMTILTLGATGILFIVTATVCSCMDPKVMARQELRGDIRVSVDAWDDDMYPEHFLYNIQQNNPLTEELLQQILLIDGVKEVDVDTAVYVGVKGKNEDDGPREADGSPLRSSIQGISSKAMEELKDYVVEGSLEDSSLTDGTGIILGEKMRDRFEAMKDWKPGTEIWLELADGTKTFSRKFRIAAIVDGPISLGGTWISMEADALQSLCETSLTDCFEITVEEGLEEKVSEAVRQLTAGLEFVEMKMYSEVLKQEEMSANLIRYGCYGVLLIFGLIGILNLVNTMINSVYVRRRELGMLQAIGMSGRQTVRMLQMEGLFYTLGTLVLSLGLGSLLGYGAFLRVKKEGIMSITTYQYPVLPAVVLALTVLAVQLLVTYLVNRGFRKESLIDRIRFAE